MTPANEVKSAYMYNIPNGRCAEKIEVGPHNTFLGDNQPIVESRKEKGFLPKEKIIIEEVQSHHFCLNKIKKRVEESRRMLLLEDNWDDDGAIAINPEIFNRATRFLEDYALRIFDVSDKILIAPDIMPVSDGSVDLEWSLENSSFLINFKNTVEDIAFYYGEFKDNDNITFDTNGQINTTAVNDKFASYLSYLSE
jgi:hypothetical protein